MRATAQSDIPRCREALHLAAQRKTLNLLSIGTWRSWFENVCALGRIWSNSQENF